ETSTRTIPLIPSTNPKNRSKHCKNNLQVTKEIIRIPVGMTLRDLTNNANVHA
ncbi:31342_t:CDS:1, partial [Racocetra persica]